MRLDICDLVVATVRGEESYGEVADYNDEAVYIYLIKPALVGYCYSTSTTVVKLENVHEVYPTNGGMYRMDAWLDIGYEYHSNNEIYDLDDETDDDASYITDESWED